MRSNKISNCAIASGAAGPSRFPGARCLTFQLTRRTPLHLPASNLVSITLLRKRSTSRVTFTTDQGARKLRGSGVTFPATRRRGLTQALRRRRSLP